MQSLKAACGSGCDARSLSTGRSIRRLRRTMQGSERARNAGRRRLARSDEGL